MFRTPSLLGPLNSGFVPFTSAGPVDAPPEVRKPPRVVARVAAPPVVETFEHAPRATWAPRSSAMVVRVEAIVVAAICAYFGFALLRAFAGL